MANLKKITQSTESSPVRSKPLSPSRPSHKPSKQQVAREAVEDFYRRHGKAMTVLAYE